jgi:membrane protein implicated in regulation of membrane protease activity
MDLLVATWTLRMAIVAALAVGGASYSAGTPAVEAVDRALAAAVFFTLAGRWLMGWLEPPERKMLRMRKRRDAHRTKKTKAEAGADAKTRAAARATKGPSTVSRTA